MKRTISLLGSTGSIGRQTLEVAEQVGCPVAALAARSSVDLLERQVRKFRPKLAVLYEMDAAVELARRVSDLPVRVAYGMEGLLEAASLDEADTVVTALVGMVGLRPTMAAIERGRRIALANKETLVCAGELVMARARACGAEIVPVDSEHSAIFQCLQGCTDRREVNRLWLTCSGGPFYGRAFSELEQVTREEALHHPNWTMGAKITVDSATLMNKGLEVVEAMHLFGVPLEQVSVVIHRQSAVHSLVQFRDGALLAQMGTADMRLPIRYALTYPQRAQAGEPALDLFRCPALTFAPPDTAAFPCLRLAMEAARTGGTACAILNGANEAAVEQFLAGEIGFNDIPRRVEQALHAIEVKWNPDLADILEADRRARRVGQGL